MGERIKEKSKGRNHDLSVAEYKVQQEEKRCDDLKEQADKKLQEKEQSERQKQALSSECSDLSRRIANYQEDYEEVTEKIREANKKADRLDEYIKNGTNAVMDMEARSKEMTEKARIAEKVHDMMVGSDGDVDMREKLIDVMYENEQLKAENSKLKQLLEKAYDFMKQFVKGEKTLFELFQEQVGMVLERIRDVVRR